MITSSSFQAAWWLTNPHMQTMYSTFMRHLKVPIDKMERFELPDGDFVDLAWVINGNTSDSPLVIFLHGLGGSMDSTYVAGQFHAFNQNGWRAVLMHFRGASKEANRLPRAYHAGDTDDLNCVLNALAKREPTTKKALVGISMGGNVALKWLGEHGSQTIIQAAVGVSVPYQLNLLADKMNQGFSRLYQAHLLKRLRAVFMRKLEKHASALPFTHKELKKLRCFWTFDAAITARLHGFSDVHAYYRESSSRQYLIQIHTPTLLIHALDDPFMTPDALPKEEELASQVTLEVSQHGGHVGFITGNRPGKPIYWLDQRIPNFLQAMLN